MVEVANNGISRGQIANTQPNGYINSSEIVPTTGIGTEATME